jgi:hypothetical protein
MKNATVSRWRLAALAVALAAVLAGGGAAMADDHKDKKRKHRAALAPPNQVYAQACGQCHMAYPPCLLPWGSWSRLLEGRANHFANDLTLGAAELKEITAYLEANGADRAGGKRGRKIMDSLGGATPLRVSEVPYLRHKHRKLAAEVLARPAVGGLGNCRACHPGAEQGDFDDHRVAVPR